MSERPQTFEQMRAQSLPVVDVLRMLEANRVQQEEAKKRKQPR